MDASYGPQNVQNLYGTVSNVTDPIGSDGVVPRKFWVSPNGTDGDANGRPDAPFLTVTFALSKCVDGRGDVIYVGPGQYAERVTVNKKNVSIIGTGGRHTGVVQIIGPGTGSTATVYVGTGYLRGFKIANMELDTNGVAVPALHLVTDSTASGGQSNSDMRFSVENVSVRSDDPDVGIMLEGASAGNVRGCLIQGPQIGVAFTGSVSNNPVDVDFEDMQFRDCVTADWATVANAANTAGRTTVAARNLTNVTFWRSRHWDIGGTPVTNYINTQGTMVNVGSFAAYFARNVGDGTAMELAANVVVIGEDGNSAVNIIGT